MPTNKLAIIPIKLDSLLNGSPGIPVLIALMFQNAFD